MIAYKCLVNGSIDAPTRQRVVDGLVRIYREHFNLPESALRVEFIEVRPGRWFTAGKPSRASMVLGGVPVGTAQPARVALMEAVCRMFSEITGAPYDDVMVVAADTQANA